MQDREKPNDAEQLARARAYIKLVLTGASRPAESVSDADAVFAYRKQLEKFSPAYADQVGAVMHAIATAPALLEQAQAFADRTEASMRELGVTGDHFTQDQRARWKQGSLRGYLGLSPNAAEQNPPGPWIPEFPASAAAKNRARKSPKPH
jgi:hypothetical protein